jgi:adenosine deaminase
LELAAEVGYRDLPASDPAGLADWFDQSGSGSLERYLEAFSETVAVMQTAKALTRVAYEAAIDLASDGVVYAEIRFAPALHTAGGLDMAEVIDAVLKGIEKGQQAGEITVRVIVDALRQDDDSMDVVRAALDFTDRGVVGFDLAGPEAGFPASRHSEACRAAIAGGLRLTLHAGEGDGPESIADAVDECGAERIGHGVRIVEDIASTGTLGPVATAIRDRAIPLEVCPSSNIDTGLFPSISEHPVGFLDRSGFVVTLNTDNRLMTGTSMGSEFESVVEHQDFSISDLRRVTLNAVDAAFCDEATRPLVRERVVAGYEGL